MNIVNKKKYGQGGALRLSTYARIGSNWEVGRYVKQGGRPQYTSNSEILKIQKYFHALK